MMMENFRSWIRRHFNLVISFVIGTTFGSSIVALAYFSEKSKVAADILRYGTRVTGHRDLDEDLVWFLCGIVVGAGVTCYAWWRDANAQKAGLVKEDVLNRLVAGPTVGIVSRPENTRQGPGK